MSPCQPPVSWPNFYHFMFLPNPQATSVNLSFYALAILHCPSYRAQCSFSFSSSDTQDFRMKLCDHGHPLLRGWMAKVNSLLLLRQTWERFHLGFGREKKNFFPPCLLFSSWLFSGQGGTDDEDREVTFRLSTQSTIFSSAGTAGVAVWALQPGDASLTHAFAGESIRSLPLMQLQKML